MRVFSAAVTTTLVGATAGSVLGGFRVGAQTADIREIKLINLTAPTTSGQVGLVRSTADGTGSPTNVIGQALDPNDVASTGFVWSNYATTLPTAGATTTTLERFAHSTNLGNGFVWTWDITSPLIVRTTAATGHILLVNLQALAPATYVLSVKWAE